MKKVSVILSLVLVVAILFGGSVKAQERKVSPQAKGAIIGTVVGAGTGVLINKKKRAVGGVVGGVVGGGAGYAVGKSIDNKQKARAAEAARVAAVRRANAAERQAAAQRAENRRLMALQSAPANTSAQGGVAVPAAVYTGYTAGQPQVMSLANMSYLPNQNYGDRSKPYSTSEYRRKSW